MEIAIKRLAWNLNRLLAIERKKVGDRVTQEVIATEAGVQQSYISAIKNGKSENPTLSIIEGIANALEVPIEELFSRPEEVCRGRFEDVVPPENVNIHKQLEFILKSEQAKGAEVVIRESYDLLMQLSRQQDA
jgi:transcriptional regulator with XRE-family HTH domain